MADEELLWKCRAQHYWLREGDGNNKFFHAVANGRRRSNTVHEVESDGVSLHREEDKWNYFYLKFKEVFAPNDGSDPTGGDWSDLFRDRGIANPDLLTAPFSTEEVKRATF